MVEQPADDEREWAKARLHLPGYSIVLVVDAERQVREFFIVDPKADCSDIDLSGRTITAAEAKDLLKGQSVRPVPPYLEEVLRLPWPTRS